MEALAIVLQRCAVHSGESPNLLCGAVWDLHDCLRPMVKQDNLLAMLAKVLKGAGKDPVAPPLAERGPSPTPMWQKQAAFPCLMFHPHQARRGCVSRRTALVARRPKPHPPGFALFNMDYPEMPPLEDVYGSLVMPMGFSLDVTAAESLQVTISHTSVACEVHYHLQAHSTSRLSLLIAPFELQLEPSSKIKEL